MDNGGWRRSKGFGLVERVCGANLNPPAKICEGSFQNYLEEKWLF
jgi:hypothetical protein